MIIRTARPEDASAMATLFFETVHSINRRDYSSEEVQTWAPRMHMAEEWTARQRGKMVYVAVEDDRVAGCAELQSSGHIDCFYTHKDMQGRGVGGELLKTLDERARSLGLQKLFAEVSITARPFFEHRGFRVLRRQEMVRRSVALTNFVVEKPLAPS